MTISKRILAAVAAVAFLGSSAMAGGSVADKYPESLLYSKPLKVAEDVWSAIGATQPYTYENAGHNNNLSFVIGEKGVLVVNGSSTYLLAKALHDEIRKLTDKPVLYVVDENGQLHATLGNSYWKEQGATIIAHADTMAELEKHGAGYVERARAFAKERADGSKLVPIDKSFTDRMTLDLGGITAELIYFGPSHSEGDISVFIPERNVLIAGDIAFHQRMLPLFPETSVKAWLETWPAFAEFAKGKTIVPGHGTVTDLATVDQYTRGYLQYLRDQVAALLDKGGTLDDAYEIDQSAYRHLDTFDELARQNAGRVFTQMEFE
ncbi:MAG TPA: MBL fold metallo-hydrolase [Chromatiales bacterium]|nr:MBL fold metallo-hydrolase [Chromatiales bacterium]